MSTPSTPPEDGAAQPRPPSAMRDMARVRVQDPRTGVWGIAATADNRYNALFGRDMVTVATDVLRHRHIGWDVARNVILTLAPHQGVRYSPDGPSSSEEEPGKYPHEHRSVFADNHGGERVNSERLAIFEMTRRRWGGTETEMTAYSSVDVTPALVRLVAELHTDPAALQRPPVLDTMFCNRAGEEITVAESVRRAVEWIETSIAASDLGLLEWRSRNPDVLTKFQTWKDSAAYIHTDGEIANWDLPMAAVEVQGLAYDALVGAAELFSTHPAARRALRAAGDADAPQRWGAAARGLQQRTLDAFWMPAAGFFAMAVDRDPRTGAPRLVRTRTSSVASLLNTRIFDQLDSDPVRNTELRRRYLEPVVRRLYSPAFLTDAGTRCRSIEHGDLYGTWDYHGDQVVWPKDVAECAQGLRRQGLPGAARQLEHRLANTVNAAGRNLEFFYVDRVTGRINLVPEILSDPDDPRQRILGSSFPQGNTSWTWSAMRRIKGERTGVVVPRPAGDDPWARRLDAALLLREPRVDLLRTRAQLATFRGRQGDFVIDRAGGRAVDRRRRRAHDAMLAASPIPAARRFRAMQRGALGEPGLAS